MADNRLQNESFVRQKTLGKAVHLDGIGVHGGQKAVVTLHPAEANHGIVFRRVDIAGPNNLIPARWDQVVNTNLCTVIGSDAGLTISTVEHLMAALAGCEIDNVLVDIDGPEAPIMDGSSAPFVDLIVSAGSRSQDAPRRALQIQQAIEIDDGHKHLSIQPHKYLSVDFQLEFENSGLASGHLAVNLVNGTFNKSISPARTFGFRSDIEALQAAGYGLGGSLDNALVVDGETILNEGGLRFKDEFVRHKILDCVGDFYLAGGPVLGQIKAIRAGHALNNALLRKIFATPGACRWVNMLQSEQQASPAFAAA
jgi:UDP-3-O-[3-hydroxymyristoyl] N-acetylglucosamine deacetylase